MPFPVFFFSFVFGQFDKDWPLTYAAARLLSFLDPPTQGWDASGRPASRPLPALSSLCVYVGVLGGDSRVSETLFPLRHSSFLLFFRLDNLSVSVKFADSSASSNLLLSLSNEFSVSISILFNAIVSHCLFSKIVSLY